ncbi:MAG TPA: hypothetical protein VK025_01740 [Steroidobacter sp.]|jgi:hypothetical protein|nr:hypothetical protein [Steroidobacteraceae bacterium]HLS80110.1 hypothetical protein [Steroidobacter sp.]
MKPFTAIFTAAVLTLLGACGSESASESQTVQASASADSAAPAPRPVAASKPDDPTAGMARAVGGGKPGAAVQIKYEFGAKPAVGAPTELTIAFIPTAQVQAMEATISGMEGVTLAGSLAANFVGVTPGQAYTHSVSVLPDRTGVFYLSVVVTTQIGGASAARTFSIPFVVGAQPTAKQKAQPARNPSGEALEEMQAEETME